jgi:beta-glucosidase
MANSGAVNGVPVHASHELLTDTLRGRLGFEGVVVSDWEDIIKLVTVHHVATDYQDAIAQAVNAGIDMSMVPLDATAFTTNLTAVVNDGRVSQERIDDAVRRILILKFRLGLFEHPLADPDEAEDVVEGADTGLARRAARESMTLLENDGTLPLSRHRGDLLVTGPSADSMQNQLGGWSIGWQGADVPGELPEGVTVREGIEAAAGDDARVRYTAGVPSGDQANDPQAVADAREAAVRRARSSDVVVAVVGERPYAEGPGDSQTAALPEAQTQLLDALEATGKPVVIVLIAGRPLMMADQLRGSAATLMAYLPGTQGGRAVADVLFGSVNPSGRLPWTWPKRVDQAQMNHDRLPGEPYDPLYAFGYGLSYTRFDYDRLDARVHRGEVDVTVSVRNRGHRSGSDTVLLFARPRGSQPGFPATKLVAFARTSLRSGERRRVDLTFPVDRLAVTAGGEKGVQPGRYELVAGDEREGLTIR